MIPSDGRRALVLGILLIAAAALLNVWTLTRILKPLDGGIDPGPKAIIWSFDAACLAIAALLVWFSPRLVVRMRTVAFSLVPLAMLLVIGEVAARVLTAPPGHQVSRLLSLQDVPVAQMIGDRVLHHKWIANLDVLQRARGITFEIRTNAQSWLEDYDIPMRKPDGTFRIFYVGDSTTAGVVSKPNRVSELVKAKLNTATPENRRTFEVINTGTSSYSTLIYYLLIKNQLLKYSPDLVVLQYDMTDVPNDLEYWPCMEFDGEGLPVGAQPQPCSLPALTPHGSVQLSIADRLQGWMYQHSALFQVATAERLKFKTIWDIRMSRSPEVAARAVEENRVAPTAQPADWVSPNWTPEIEANVQRSMRVLGAAISLLTSRNIRVMVTGMPHYLQFTGEWSTRPHSVLRDLTASNGVPFLNSYDVLKPTIAGTPVDTYYWSSDNTHFNERGNALWADAEVKFMMEHGLLDDRP